VTLDKDLQTQLRGSGGVLATGYGTPPVLSDPHALLCAPYVRTVVLEVRVLGGGGVACGAGTRQG